jgi:thioredoxin 1
MKTATRTIILFFLFCLLNALPVVAQQEVPEAAKERFKAGLGMIEKADKPADFLAAMTEFEAAAALAPQWPDIHYNLAKLAAETDKPAKAIKEYSAYLTLSPAAGDRAEVEKEIVKLKEQIVRKRKIGLPGVKFAALPDGIGVLQIFPGSRIAKTGLKQGDKIVSVDPPKITSTGARYTPTKEKSAAVHTLEDFFKAIENADWGSDNSIRKASSERIFSRVSGRDTAESGPVMTLSVIRGGELFPILIKKSMFQSKVIEIEEEEFEAEVLKESLPVVATFWNSGCPFCRQFTPIVEAKSAEYAGKVKFVNINVDENRKLAQQLQIKGVPTLMVFKGGMKMSTDMGSLPKEKVEEILKSAVER